MGSNMAEAHPVGFRWPLKARERGAKLIHIDPRFTRTSAMATTHIAIRAGSDIAFLGGIINYILTHDRWFKEYVLAYTNATTIIDDRFRDTEDLGGLFSGFDLEAHEYDPVTGHWNYEFEGEKDDHSGEPDIAPQETGPQTPEDASKMSEERERTSYGSMGSGRGPHIARTDHKTDPSLQHPRCVLNILKRHYSRYTPEIVAQTCGCTPEELIEVAETLCENSGRERTSAFVYAVGWTQHTTGVQIISAASVIQLLLGNAGRPGGGVMAMRGHASIQGSTDIPTLYDMLPSYLPQPTIYRHNEELDDYVQEEGGVSGGWSNFRKYIVSLLKAWYGEAATADNQFCWKWIPREDDNYSHLAYFDKMAKGEVDGYIVFGQNPAGGGPNAGLHRAGLRSLKWLVVMDWFMTETATFWKDDPKGPGPAEVGTELFYIPAANIVEKEGSMTNTQRLLQWHDKALDPPGECRSDLWFVYNLGKKLRKLYEGSTEPRDQPLLNLTWNYDYDETPRLPDGTHSQVVGEPDASKILREINGFKTAETDPKTGKPVPLGSYQEIKDDGSTACGAWIYCGVFPEAGRNRARSRERSDTNPLNPDWGWAWPHNRRIMYNRASADPEGRPWSERKKLIWWDEELKKWSGLDEPDFEPDKPPGYRAPKGARGMAAISGDSPFIMKSDGKGWLFAPAGTKDAPMPTHYEPIESPIKNPLYETQTNRATMFRPGPLNELAASCSPEFPIVGTTFRLTEHYLSGPMSRFNSWLSELQPGMFAEISPQLATERGITHGGWMTVSTARAAIECRAMVTDRLRPLDLNGRVIHQIGIPFHFGYSGEVVGAVANDLTSLVLDPNVSIHEAKAFTCQVRAGRLPGTKAQPTTRPAPWPTVEPAPRTPQEDQPEGHMRGGPLRAALRLLHHPMTGGKRDR